MFYSIVRAIFIGVSLLFNGRPDFEGKENLPQQENYLLVAPHRTFWDALYLAWAASPKKLAFMAKKELFEVPVVGFFLRHGQAFPVDREKPGLSSIKKAVSILKESSLSLLLFPTGGLHKEEIKGGAVLIAKLADVPIVPAVFQGPMTVKELFCRKKVKIRFGRPLEVSKTDKKALSDMEEQIQQAFTALDKAIDPTLTDK